LKNKRRKLKKNERLGYGREKQNKKIYIKKNKKIKRKNEEPFVVESFSSSSSYSSS
jgi:hypothetical protein